MGFRERTKKQRDGERGNTLYMVAASLFVLLGMGALAIDLASLYVARNEAQRVADSAALAGAKVFVESGCVTSETCALSAFETEATNRATQVGMQNLVEGQAPASIQVAFDGNYISTQNPQITVQVQSANLHVYFAGAIGITTAPSVGATATAEAYNPSGAAAGAPIFCTGCVRPWLIANCDQSTLYSNPASTLCSGEASLLNPANNYSVSNPNCTPAGVIGAPIDIQLQAQPTLYGALDVDNGSGNLADYQSAITTCFTGQTTCGARTLTILPYGATTGLATTMAVENLMHITAAGPGLGQDTIDVTVCPPQIHAGALNPLVTNGVVNPNELITTSDSIVTAYIFDGTPLQTSTATTVTQPMTIVGFAQIFVTQADPANPGEFLGYILGVAGCGSNPGACGNTSIQGPTMLPVRLIQQPAN